MPIHDWTRVDEEIFHAFHVNWTVELAKALNAGILSGDYYALPEQVAGETHPDMLTLRQAAFPEDPARPAPPPTTAASTYDIAFASIPRRWRDVIES